MVFIGSLLIFYSKLPADNNATEEGGLDVSSGFVDQNLYGSLVFSAQLNEASSSERQFYRYDFAEERVSVYLQENVQNENITKKVQWIGEGSDASSSYDRIIVVDKETGSSEFLSTDDVINEADLVVSPDGTHVAYSYQTAGVTDSSSIANWNVAVRNILTGETRTVPGAIRPTFYRDSAAILFMTPAGITEYDMNTKSEPALVFDFGPLTPNDEYAVSPDSQHLILTSPDYTLLTTAVVSSASTTTFVEVANAVTPATSYYNPVISADNKYYALVSTDEAGVATIEIRTLDTSQVVKKISSELVGLRIDSLQEWTVPGYTRENIRTDEIQ